MFTTACLKTLDTVSEPQGNLSNKLPATDCLGCRGGARQLGGAWLLFDKGLLFPILVRFQGLVFGSSV